jgi:hypothetical protein
MILLTSLAALSLGAAPVQAPDPVRTPAPTGPVKVEAAQAVPALPAKAHWKPEPKPWLKPVALKPAARPATAKLRQIS